MSCWKMVIKYIMVNLLMKIKHIIIGTYNNIFNK